MTRFRVEIERILEYLANEYRKPCFTTMVVERVKTPPKGKLILDLSFCRAGTHQISVLQLVLGLLAKILEKLPPA